MEKQPNSRMCFVCGLENPVGLKLAFYTDERGRCITRYRPRPEHQGFPGNLHGGIISTLLDETMGRVLLANEFSTTGKLEIRFRKPVPLDQELILVGELIRRRSRAYEARGEIQLPNGTTLVEATGMYVFVPNEAIEQIETELGFWKVVPD